MGCNGQIDRQAVFKLRIYRKLTDLSYTWTYGKAIQGVAMDYLKFHPDLPCPILLCLAGGPALEQPYGRLRGGAPTGWSTRGHLLSLWIPHVVRLMISINH
jgi:hypothetical protein